MSAPFESLVGTWLFVRSTRTPFKPRHIYHFTADGELHWELDIEDKRTLRSLEYRLSDRVLSLIYRGGSQWQSELTEEDDGSVQVRAPSGDFWWMIRLAAPETYSIAFVDHDGVLQKLK